MKRRITLAGAMLLGAASLGYPSSSAELTLREVDLMRAPRQTFGAAVHFAPTIDVGYAPPRAIPIFNSLGLDSFREDLLWPEFIVSKRISDRITQFAHGTKARPLFILAYARDGVSQAALTVPGTWQSAYGAFARDAAMSVGHNGLLEIGNEWNLTRDAAGKRLAPDASGSDPRSAIAYARLVKATIVALRQGASGARLLSGAVGEDAGWAWTQALVRAGGAGEGADLSVHVYNQCKSVENRTASEAIGQMTTLKAALSRIDHRPFKVFVTEIGWPTSTAEACGITPLQQAQNLSQFLLWTSTQPWIGGVWLYQLKDQGTAADDFEQNFGVFRYDYSEKPAACAVREALRLIRSADKVMLSKPLPGIRLLAQLAGSHKRLILWTEDPHARWTLRLARRPVSARALCGSKTTTRQIPITAVPVVVTLTSEPLPRLNFDYDG